MAQALEVGGGVTVWSARSEAIQVVHVSGPCEAADPLAEGMLREVRGAGLAPAMVVAA